MKIAAFSLLLYVLAGCVSTSVEIPRDHPANPSATTPPLAIASPLASTPLGPSSSEPEPGHRHHGHGQDAAQDSAALPGGSSNSPTPAPGAQGKATATHEPASEVWTCPMHSDVVKSGPGQCPICGMNLVKRPAGKGAH